MEVLDINPHKSLRFILILKYMCFKGDIIFMGHILLRRGYIILFEFLILYENIKRDYQEIYLGQAFSHGR